MFLGEGGGHLLDLSWDKLKQLINIGFYIVIMLAAMSQIEHIEEKKIDAI